MISADGMGDPEAGFPRNDSAVLDLGLRVVSDGRYSSIKSGWSWTPSPVIS